MPKYHFPTSYVEMPGRGTSPLSSGCIFIREADPDSEEDANEKEEETTGLPNPYYSCNEDKEHCASFFEQYAHNNRSSRWFARDFEELTGTKTLAVTFDQKPETKFKEQAAVLEACRRIGCHASIWIDGSEANADFLSEIEDFKAEQQLQIYCKGNCRNTDYSITIRPQKDKSTGMTGSSEKIHKTLTWNGTETVDSSEKMGTSMGKRKTPDDSSEEFGRRRSNIKTLKLSSEEMDATNGNKKSTYKKVIAVPNPTRERNCNNIGNLLMTPVSSAGCHSCPGCVLCAGHLRDTTTFSSVVTGQSFHIRDCLSCTSTNVVYLIDCDKCHGKQYVGETGQTVRRRFYGHTYTIRKDVDTLVAKHFRSPEHSLSDMRVTVIEQVKIDNVDIRRQRERFWRYQLHTNYPEGLNL